MAKRGSASKYASGSQVIIKYGKSAPEKLRAIADDPETNEKSRIDIEKWFAEMVYGKTPNAMQKDADGGRIAEVKFKGKLEEWSR